MVLEALILAGFLATGQQAEGQLTGQLNNPVQISQTAAQQSQLSYQELLNRLVLSKDWREKKKHAEALRNYINNENGFPPFIKPAIKGQLYLDICRKVMLPNEQKATDCIVLLAPSDMEIMLLENGVELWANNGFPLEDILMDEKENFELKYGEFKGFSTRQLIEHMHEVYLEKVKRKINDTFETGVLRTRDAEWRQLKREFRLTELYETASKEETPLYFFNEDGKADFVLVPEVVRTLSFDEFKKYIKNGLLKRARELMPLIIDSHVNKYPHLEDSLKKGDKLYCYLTNTDFDILSQEDMKRYVLYRLMQRAESVFSNNANNGVPDKFTLILRTLMENFKLADLPFQDYAAHMLKKAQHEDDFESQVWLKHAARASDPNMINGTTHTQEYSPMNLFVEGSVAETSTGAAIIPTAGIGGDWDTMLVNLLRGRPLSPPEQLSDYKPLPARLKSPVLQAAEDTPYIYTIESIVKAFDNAREYDNETLKLYTLALSDVYMAKHGFMNDEAIAKFLDVFIGDTPEEAKAITRNYLAGLLQSKYRFIPLSTQRKLAEYAGNNPSLEYVLFTIDPNLKIVDGRRVAEMPVVSNHINLPDVGVHNSYLIRDSRKYSDLIASLKPEERAEVRDTVLNNLIFNYFEYGDFYEAAIGQFYANTVRAKSALSQNEQEKLLENIAKQARNGISETVLASYVNIASAIGRADLIDGNLEALLHSIRDTAFFVDYIERSKVKLDLGKVKAFRDKLAQSSGDEEKWQAALLSGLLGETSNSARLMKCIQFLEHPQPYYRTGYTKPLTAAITELGEIVASMGYVPQLAADILGNIFATGSLTSNEESDRYRKMFESNEEREERGNELAASFIKKYDTAGGGVLLRGDIVVVVDDTLPGSAGTYLDTRVASLSAMNKIASAHPDAMHDSNPLVYLLSQTILNAERETEYLAMAEIAVNTLLLSTNPSLTIRNTLAYARDKLALPEQTRLAINMRLDGRPNTYSPAKISKGD